jgi:hypothetical protein
MPKVTIVFALLLIALGGGLYVGSGMESVTALIPAFFGVVFLILGLVARNPARLKMAMHIAAVLALLGIGGSARGFGPALKSLSGEAIQRPSAAWGQVSMALLCLVYLVLCIRSFVQVRRARAKTG